MPQLRDCPLSGLEARGQQVISSEAPRVGLPSRCAVFFPAWVWPLAKSQLGWDLLGFGKTTSEALWQRMSDPSGKVHVCVCKCISAHMHM